MEHPSSGPPPVPPRIDLGETEETLPVGNPEVSTVSANPVDQSLSPASAELKTDSSLLTSREADENNCPDRLTAPSGETVKINDVDKKRPAKPAPPPPKPALPHDVQQPAGRKPVGNLSTEKIKRVPVPEKKTKSHKKDSLSSVFYVKPFSNGTASDQTVAVKTEHDRLAGESGAKPAKAAVKIKQAKPTLKKAKPKEGQKAAETQPILNRKQTEPEVSKPKLKPTIITAKKPKKEAAGGGVNNSDKTKTTSSSALIASVQNIEDIGAAQGSPPGRPNFPPNTAVEQRCEAIQPQRPKAPPNALHEDQTHLEKMKERKKNFKNEQSTQAKQKAKPLRPPMAKESARIKPARPAPTQPNVARKMPSAKSAVQPEVGKKLAPEPPVKTREPESVGGPPRAVAKFDYASGTKDDLSFKAGDTVMLLSKVDDDWFVGYVEGDVMHQGLFPSSFVDIIVNIKDLTKEDKLQELSLSGPYGVAVHDFQGQGEDELSFSSGQTIILIEKVNEEWLRGKMDGAVGIFPRNFVRVERDLPASTETNSNDNAAKLPSDKKARTEKPGDQWCRAIHDFQGKHGDDLSFVAGSEIRVTERLDDDWLRGVYSGETGIFPASFVEMIRKPSATTPGVIVVTAVHDYPGGSPEDLSFNSGDQIRVVEQINSDWLLGELNGKEGLFPASFVESTSESVPRSSVSGPGEADQSKDVRVAKALHDFTGEHAGELHFRTGDVIKVIREIDSNWCEGMINDVSGMFPTSFVQMEPLKTKGPGHARAVYDYEGDSPQDLSFKAGDEIQLLERINEDWWMGTCAGKTGHFPANFVEIIPSATS